MRQRLFWLAAVGTVLVACGGDTGNPVGPVPGVLVLRLTTSQLDARAMLLTVTGPDTVTAVEAANTGYQAYARVSERTFKAAVFGTLANGPLLEVTVPDIAQAAEYSVTVHEVADGANILRPIARYSVTIER